MAKKTHWYAPAAILGAASVLLTLHQQRGSPSEPEENVAPPSGPPHMSTPEHHAPATEAEIARNSTHVVNVSIGDEIASVQLRQRAWYTVEDPESLGDAYHSLANRASAGDVVAAFSLSKRLRQCDEQPFVSEDELEMAIAQVHSSGTLPFRSRGFVIDQPADPSIEESVRETFEFCKGVPSNLRAQYFDWLRLAADLGDPLSQVQFAQQLPDRSPEAVDYFTKAWKSGDIDAAGWLARAYKLGFQGAGADPVKSHAFLLLYAELVRADYSLRGMSDDPAARNWMEADERSLRESEAKLSESEMAKATALAQSLLKNNTNCCLLRAH